MSSDRISKLRRVCGIATTCIVILAGICLMVACVGIYRSGEEPFSRASVAAAFAPISIPVYLCLALVVADLVLNALFPAPAEKITAPKQYSVMLKRLQERYDMENAEESLKAQILGEQVSRSRLYRACGAVCALCGFAFLAYALDGSHFHTSQINDSMIRAMMVLAPCLVVSLAMCLYTVSARQKSMLREMELLKQCPKKTAEAAQAPAASSGKIKYALLLAAIALAVFGFLSGGTADVLTKAVNICTECIGLG